MERSSIVVALFVLSLKWIPPAAVGCIDWRWAREETETNETICNSINKNDI